MARRTPAATTQAVKKLPWPKALRQGRELSMTEVYRTGQLIVEKVRQKPARFNGISISELAHVLGSSPPTLYRAVKAYEAVNKYELHDRLQDVPPTLLYNLDRLPPNRRRRFMKKALQEGWSKREIIRQTTDVLEATLGDDWQTQRVRTSVLTGGRPKKKTNASSRNHTSTRSNSNSLPQLKALQQVSEQLSDKPPPKKELTPAQLKQARQNLRVAQRLLKKWDKALS